MPGSVTTPGRAGARVSAPDHVAFRRLNSVGTRDKVSFAAQWLACTLPYRRFACILADACARLGADVVRYTFIATDLHRLLLAGLPAHPTRLPEDPSFVCRSSTSARQRGNNGRTGAELPDAARKRVPAPRSAIESVGPHGRIACISQRRE